MSFLADQARAEWRAALNERGETIKIRRYTGAGPNRPRFDVDVMAVVTGFAPKDFVGSLVLGDRFALVLAEDLIEAQFALPITASDKAVVREKELAIIAPDDSTIRVGPDLIAYALQVRG